MESTLVLSIMLYLPLTWGQSQFETEGINVSYTWVHHGGMSRKTRAASMMKDPDRLEITRLHNSYRSMVSPSAADMEYMEWDDRIASVSQRWADRCIWKHSKDTSTTDFPDGLGENLYRGWSSSPAYAMSLWYNEYPDYDIQTTSCKRGKMCGHYTQMVWSKSRLVGCGIKEGCWKDYRYYIVCNYSPPGNYKGEKPYRIGRSCSQCHSGSGLCFNKSCVNRSQCEKYNLDCGCDLVCHNCGELNRHSCTCKCKDGWKGVDCSEPCQDAQEDCLVSACSFHERWSRGSHPCEKTCNVCKSVTPDSLQNTCCDGVTCPPGEVLDLSERPCECRKLCSGPKCQSSLHEPHSLFLLVAMSFFLSCYAL